MRDKVTHPPRARATKALKIPQEERATFRRLLKSLVTTGELVETKGGRVGLPDKMDLVVGRLQMHAAGFGFVIPDKAGGDAPDVYVSAANIKEAMHGDRVLVRIERRTVNPARGRIIRILERGNSTIVGRFDLA
jgi:ribonuclease R